MISATTSMLDRIRDMHILTGLITIARGRSLHTTYQTNMLTSLPDQPEDPGIIVVPPEEPATPDANQGLDPATGEPLPMGG